MGAGHGKKMQGDPYQDGAGAGGKETVKRAGNWENVCQQTAATLASPLGEPHY